MEKIKLLTKSESDTDNSYGKRPNERSIDELIKKSIVVVDKHSGPTSHQVTKWVADIFGLKTAGHAGTLDPGVTGVLPVALGDARKAMPVLIGGRKEYVGIMRIHDDVDEQLLRDIMLKFVGKIKQRPPIKSAVARKIREREIYFLDILEKKGRDVLFHVGCEAGTYIRKLCHDIGEALGTGAHMTELRRVKACEFKEEDAYTLIELKDAYEFWKENGDEKELRKILIPVEYAIMHVKRIFVKDSAIHSITNGSPVYAAGISMIQDGITKGETMAIYSLKDELVALGIARMTSDEMMKAKKGTAVRTDRVFIGRDVYPKT